MDRCKVCNCDLGLVPMCFGSSSPALMMVPEAEYHDRVEENDDQCIIDGEQFFLRGHIELPLIDLEEVFIWSVWVSLSKQSFDQIRKHWETEGRETNEPYFGWLMTNLPCYPETLHLKTSVQSQSVGHVPLITLEPNEHPLALEQKSGITMERVHEIIHQVLEH